MVPFKCKKIELGGRMSNETKIQATVVEIIQRYLEDDGVKILPSTRLIGDLSIDSLDLLDISFDLEQELNVTIPINEWTANEEISAEEFVEMLTLQRIVDYVLEEQK